MLVPIDYYIYFNVVDMDHHTLFELYNVENGRKDVMNVNDFTITSLDKITGYSLTGDYLFTIDELSEATIANAEEKTDITGRGGRKLGSLKRNKTVTINGTNGLISGGLLEMQTGSDFTSVAAASVKWADYLTVSADGATTTYKATGTAGAEIDAIYIQNADGTVGAKLVQDTAVAEGKFTYNPSTKKISFKAGDYADGTEIVAYYYRKVAANVLENESDVYSRKCALFVDVTCEDKCNNVYHGQFYIPKADFSGNFDVAMGDNQTVHSFEAESLAGACGAGGKLWTYTIFGVDAEDAA